jgi:hypothetical protein
MFMPGACGTRPPAVPRAALPVTGPGKRECSYPEPSAGDAWAGAGRHAQARDGRYVGQITYTIRDVYGFYDTDKFLGYSRKMHYLQGVCGAPAYRGGAHWFYTSVVVTVPFDQNS